MGSHGEIPDCTQEQPENEAALLMAPKLKSSSQCGSAQPIGLLMTADREEPEP